MYLYNLQVIHYPWVYNLVLMYKYKSHGPCPCPCGKFKRLSLCPDAEIFLCGSKRIYAYRILFGWCRKLPRGASLGVCCTNVWIFSCHVIKAVDNEQLFYMWGKKKKLGRAISGKPLTDWMFSLSFSKQCQQSWILFYCSLSLQS